MELYYKETCPYCQRVLSFLKGKKHSIRLKEIIVNPEFRKELEAISNNNSQVPCLVVEGRPMLESGDIIEYLRKRLA